MQVTVSNIKHLRDDVYRVEWTLDEKAIVEVVSLSGLRQNIETQKNQKLMEAYSLLLIQIDGHLHPAPEPETEIAAEPPVKDDPDAVPVPDKSLIETLADDLKSSKKKKQSVTSPHNSRGSQATHIPPDHVDA